MQFIISRSGLKIALLGNNRDCLASLIESYGIEYTLLSSHEELTDETLAFCINYYKLLPESALNNLRFGAWTFHGSDLPKGRGWAPLSWTLINDEPSMTLTLFKVDTGTDTGLIFEKESVPIYDTTTIELLRKKSLEMTVDLARKFLDSIMHHSAVELRQQIGEPSHYDRRTPKDSELDPTQPLTKLWTKMRACHNTAYPAFFKLGGHKVILRYEVKRL